MKLLSILTLAASTCIQQVAAQDATWYFLRYYTPSDSVQFTSFSGDLHVPSLPQAATYYVWPGLQDINTTGVFQSVLDGRSGTWWIGDGWCCSDPDLSWGGGFNAHDGDVVHFTYSRDTTDANWSTTLTLDGEASSLVTGSFPLAYKSFDQVLLAIELYGVAWDFGSVIYENVVITTNSTDTAWCLDPPENYESATNYTLTDVMATVDNVTRTMTCSIGSINLWAPA